MRRLSALCLVSIVALAAACSSSDDADGSPGPAGPPPKLTPLPSLTTAKTTVDETLGPVKSTQADAKTLGNPAVYTNLPDLRAAGYGDLQVGPGEGYTARTLDGSAPPAPGPNAKRLTRFVHLSDFQLLDDESPTRSCSTDGASMLSSAARPQDLEMCRLANAAVRTTNGLHAKEPLDFVVMGGDNVDNAQSNELDWFLSILNGSSEVHCDSGEDDDPVPGPDNDGKDPFFAEGLKVPWKWVMGNHDVLGQGNFPITEKRKQDSVQERAPLGTRDYREGGAFVNDDVIPDPKRVALFPTELLGRVAGDHDGHGVSAEQATKGRAFHAFEASPKLLFFVLDTTHAAGGAEGVLRMADIDAVIKPVLEAAKAKGQAVILVSHHSADSFTEDGGSFGSKEPDALTPEQWKDFLGGYPNVVFHLTGHAHEQRVKLQKGAVGQGYWDVMTAAIADFPHTFRLIEVFDQDNGFLMLRSTVVNLHTADDPIAKDAVVRGTIDWTTGYNPGGEKRGKVDDRNVELWIPMPK